MYTYFVTFRIADGAADKITYSDRYNALMENLQAARAQKGGFWDRTTSFVAMESTLGTDQLCKALSKGLSASKDEIVVFDPSDMSMAYFGAVDEAGILASFFKSAKKV